MTDDEREAILAEFRAAVAMAAAAMAEVWALVARLAAILEASHAG